MPLRRPKQRRIQIEIPLPLVQAEALERLLVALAQKLRKQPRPRHPRAEVGIVVAALAHLVDAGHDVGRLEGEMRLEPRPEDVLHFPRQPDQVVEGALRTVPGRGLHDVLELMVGEERDHRGDVHIHRNAGFRKTLYRQ